jgi:hypothetical protein
MRPRQVYLDRGSLAGLADEADMPVALFDEAVGRAEPLAGALPAVVCSSYKSVVKRNTQTCAK